MNDIRSVKDAEKLKDGEQFYVVIDDMNPREPSETDAEFDARFSRGLKLRDEIFAAVGTKKTPPGQEKKERHK